MSDLCLLCPRPFRKKEITQRKHTCAEVSLLHPPGHLFDVFRSHVALVGAFHPPKCTLFMLHSEINFLAAPSLCSLCPCPW